MHSQRPAATALAVTVAVAGVHPAIAYCIVVVPGLTMVTVPVVLPTVATEVVELDHMPPATASVRLVTFPVDPQIFRNPVMAAGKVFTVTAGEVTEVLLVHPVPL